MRVSLRPAVASLHSQIRRSTSRQNVFRSIGVGLILGCVGWLHPAAVSPGRSAERIYVSYNLLERSIPVASLEAYARTGTIDDNLAVYAQFAGEEALKQLRTGLLAKAEIEPVAISQFLYSPQGEALLQRLGQVIQSESRDPGFKAIRAALILAAADPEGLTPLNVLRKFPTRGIRIDVRRSLEIAAALQTAVNQTNQATVLVNQLAVLEAGTEVPIAFEQLPDLRRPGPFTWQKQTFTLIDLNRSAIINPIRGYIRSPLADLRGRLFPVDLYLPEIRSRTAPAPVVVISHGLGGDRNTFTYLAQQLASYGFAVLVPEHPGSNAKQLEALINGTASEVAEPTEFVNRPLDITYLLNEMERRVTSDSNLQGRLNLQQVGVVGQSFGGYTALALGGAPINPQQLQAECRDLANTLNISLLLQCRATLLGTVPANLSDPRIKAVLAINPINSAVFGPASLSQITVPIMIVSGSADTAAPALPEQIQPFTWLTTPNKYLVLMERGTHFSTFAGGPGGAIPIPEEVVGPNPEIARRYLNALSVAFFQTYIANQPNYRVYLTAAYTEAISEAAISLSLIRSLTADQLQQAINGTPTSSSPPVSTSEPVPQTQ